MATMSVLAFKPTANSLFKNLNNMDVKDNTVIVTYNIKRATNSGSEYFNNKFYFEKESSSSSNICQLNYSSGVLSETNIDEIKCFRKRNILDGANTLQGIFYSIATMFAQNSPDAMIKFLKKNGSQIKYNKELLNQSQNFYLYKYKKYLTSKADGSNEANNPLVTGNADKDEAIRKVLAQSYLREDAMVKRVKSGNYFFWKIQDSVVSATFDNDKNHLMQMNLNLNDQKYELTFRNYMLISSNFEHPELIELKTPEGVVYEIKAKKVQVIEDNPNSYDRRISKLKGKILKEVESPSKIELLK